MAQPPPECASFSQVLRDELAAIEWRRQALHKASQAEDAAAEGGERWTRANFTQMDEVTASWADQILERFLDDVELVRFAEAYARCSAGTWRASSRTAGWTPGSLVGWITDAVRDRRFRWEVRQVYRDRFQCEPSKTDLDDASLFDEHLERDVRRAWFAGREAGHEPVHPDPGSFESLCATALWARWQVHDAEARSASAVASGDDGSADAASWRRLSRDESLCRAIVSHFKARILRDQIQTETGNPTPGDERQEAERKRKQRVREALVEYYYAQFRSSWLGRDWEWGVVGGANAEKELADVRREAMDSHLAGLAFSGGGIRAATFAVGMIQGLASLKLLRWFDILSTVSGGGYAGSWLTAWIAREGDPLNVERQLGTNRIDQADADRTYLPRTRVVEEEPEPLRHLRQYSSYLNPRPGLFSIDTWTVLAIYLRNLLINLLLLIPALLLIVFALHGLAWAYDALLAARGIMTAERIPTSPHFTQVGRFLSALFNGDAIAHVTCAFGVGLVLVMVGFFGNAVALRRLRNHEPGDKRPGTAYLTWWVVVPIVAGAVFLAGALPAGLDLLRESVRIDLAGSGSSLTFTGKLARWVFGPQADVLAGVANATYLSWPNVLLHAVVCGLCMLILGALQVFFSWRWEKSQIRQSRHHRAQGTLYPPFAALMAGFLGGAALAVAEDLLRTVQSQPWLMLAVGPSALLIVVSVAITALVALLSRRADESEREWWASFAARMLWMGAVWTILILVIGYGPALLVAAPVAMQAALATGWAGLTAVAGRLGYLATLKRGGGGRTSQLFLAVAPVLILAGLLAALSLVATLLLNGSVPDAPRASVIARYLDHSLGRGTWANPFPFAKWSALFWKIAILAAFLAGALSWISVNLFSLNAFYANRLVRCFLGASRPRADWETRWGSRRRPFVAGAPTGAFGANRAADRVTGFDQDDDLPLADLAIGRAAADSDQPDPPRYWGPHYLVNTALSLISGDELAWRDRKAAAFVLSPLYCGSKVTGYAPTTRTRENLTLGRAVAISGAAVDPNMSLYQTGALTALLTVLNVRLGHWLRNLGPDQFGDTVRPWQANEPAGNLLLVHELAGNTNAREAYVRLTDGGHFENLGVYELLRRRVRYIVAVDATENRNATSDNLGILVRLARVDFGIRIQLDTSPLAVTLPDNLSRAHVSIGRIRYDDVDNDQMPGLLVYVRSSLTGDEPPDVQQYANTHPEFPREGTIDQSFDENQFESYRALGEHVAQSVFETAARELLTSDTIKEARDGRDLYIRAHRRMFASLRNLWSNPPLDQDERAMQATRAWVTLQRDLRTDRKLAALSKDLYPELALLEGGLAESGRYRAEIHALEQMLQTMEDAWLGLGMKGYPDLPMNRGWMNTLRRLASSETFRTFWPVLRSQHSPEFVRFCEEQLRLQTSSPRLRPIAVGDPALSLLGGEFAREWPREVRRTESETLDEAGLRYVSQRVERAICLPAGVPGEPAASDAAWLILQGSVEHNPQREPGLEFPLGLLAMTPVIPALRNESAGDGGEARTENDLIRDDGPERPAGPLRSDDPLADYELFLWVRRAYRSTRVGDTALRLMMGELEKHYRNSNTTFRTRVRFPGDQHINLERDRDLWINFFSTFDFKPAPGARETLEGSRILYNKRTL